MDLNEKIKQILADKNISPSIFADEIGIQRSSMSHIIAGRNKPSLDIIQKIIKRFPDLGLNWVFEDENLPTGIATSETSSYVKSEIPRVSKPRVSTRQQSQQPAAAEVQEKSVSIEKKIERVLIFYTDGSFKEYKDAN
ncbi:helix-turn-helix transcriptional regulator [Dyadobacter luticola]|uniref:Helix-turn-helix transcriptional regulator n=1 Tax=Dyadobacter luticola TaxID=1979387 RepID=A0A5R9L3W1_9BACT|nr:helix-turn-helix transcriptional regulator [Dyadobacter luticola]TLV02965.1 helix-turn-helix transcriptional regulator [Dyadobacter luticola]